MQAYHSQLSDEGILPLVVGVDLGGTQIRAAVLRGATLLSRVSLLTGADSSADIVIPRMWEAVEQALTAAAVTREQIAGIGIGAPGPLDGRTGVVFSPPNLVGWRNVPLHDIFFTHFNVPIFVENDANVAALAEYMFGAGRGSQEIVYLTLSTGIGGGVIARGRILAGSVGTAAELGHMTIDLRGPRCNCGNIGCLESLASGTAIARRARELIDEGKAAALLDFARVHQGAVEDDTPFDRASRDSLHVNARTVAQAARAGIPEACAIIEQAAEALGVGLVNIIHIFNPERVILGGGVSQIGEPLLAPALRIVEERAMSVPGNVVQIVLAELGPDVGIIGAGALTYYNHR
ncbi:MAG: ROK family protein [Ktedonobacteraceae bacterium]